MKLRLSEDPVFRQKVFEKSKNRLSKLHLKIRKFLDLDSLGFEPEQVALRYFADELNKANNFIIEINGDYTHANPKIYGPNDIIRLPGQSFLAKEKWEADLIRKNKLEQAGYIVFTIWQSDDWGIKKEELLNLLGTIVESDKLLQNLDVSLNK
jgi:very-short-patch-repair endonuclease